MYICYFAVQKDETIQVDSEMALVLQCSRFTPDFSIQVLDCPDESHNSTPQVTANVFHVLNPV